METEGSRPPWYRRWRYILPLGLLAILVVASLFPVPPGPPKSRDNIALNRAVYYFATKYNGTLGLIPEHPGSHTYWLYSDNYLAALAVARYSSNNQSTVGFASAIETALSGYGATIPPPLRHNEYMALNSTAGYFDCPANYTISWSTGRQAAPGTGSAVLRTTANDGGPSCSSKNYADLLFLQALYYHRSGNTAEAAQFYQAGAKDFDGSGIVDEASNGTTALSTEYQTYKLALFVYSTYCLGMQSSAPGLSRASSVLLYMQSNSTGGFATTYFPVNATLQGSHTIGVVSGTGTDTETTAIATLAVELMIDPAGSC